MRQIPYRERMDVDEVSQMLDQLAEFLSIKHTTSTGFCKKISELFTRSELIASCKFLQDTWEKRHFPMYPDFRDAFLKTFQKDKQYETWQHEYADRLGIPVESFPDSVMKLTDNQRMVLGIPSEPERKQMMAKIFKTLELRGAGVQIKNKLLDDDHPENQKGVNNERVLV